MEYQKTISKPKFDIRIDSLPENCTINHQPTSCEEATNCNRSSGIYNLTDTNYSNNTFLAYCDEENYDGNWLQILKVIDGSENFNRPWMDYVNGFGDINGEFWLGLEKLYALTNFYGTQELNIHLENFEGRTAFLRYDNFVVGNADEKYQLKSLGRYTGTIKDDLYSNVGQKFSTYDNDNDMFFRNCARLREGGFWFSDCGSVHPTGPYLRGSYKCFKEGSFWKSFEGMHYAPKTIIFMIRRRNDAGLN
ncbi:angiopoietin-related protein 2-like [Cochliomyia hominivorax]